MENEQWPIMPIFQTIKVVLVLAIGIGYDTLLIRFLKKRNQSIGPGQVRLVPWKSSNDSGNSDENNILVPVSATIISLVGVFVCFGIAFSFTQRQDYACLINKSKKCFSGQRIGRTLFI